MNYLIRNAHFIVIHVPLAMLLFSFLFDLAARLFKKSAWHSAGMLCLVVGTLGAIASVVTGPEDRNPLRETHEFYGKISMIFFIVLTLIRLWLLYRGKKEIGGHPAYLAAALIGAALITYTGHLGGEMVHPDRGPFSRDGNFQRFGDREGRGSFQGGRGGDSGAPNGGGSAGNGGGGNGGSSGNGNTPTGS